MVGRVVAEAAGSVEDAVEAGWGQDEEAPAGVDDIAQQGQGGRADGSPFVGGDLEAKRLEHLHRRAAPRGRRRLGRRSGPRRRRPKVVDIAEGAKSGRPQRREDWPEELGPSPRRQRQTKGQDLGLVQPAPDAEDQEAPDVPVER